MNAIKKIKNYFNKIKENKQKKIESDLMRKKLASAIMQNCSRELEFLRKKIEQEFEDKDKIREKKINLYNEKCNKCGANKSIDVLKTYGYGKQGCFGLLSDIEIGQKPHNKCGSCGHEWVRKNFVKENLFHEKEIFNRAIRLIYLIDSLSDETGFSPKSLTYLKDDELFIFFKECKIETMYFFYIQGVYSFRYDTEEEKEKNLKKFNKEKLIEIGFKEFDLKEFEEKKEKERKRSQIFLNGTKNFGAIHPIPKNFQITN